MNVIFRGVRFTSFDSNLYADFSKTYKTEKEKKSGKDHHKEKRHELPANADIKQETRRASKASFFTQQ